MQKTRPRRTGSKTASEGGAERTPVGKGRPTHVRNRLIVAAAVVAAAIAGAGAPSILTASGQLKDSQDLVTLAEETQDALALAQAIADERDEVTTYIAAGRTKTKAPSGQSSARVDRQVRELTADTDLPAALRRDLGGVASVRQAALTGRSTAVQAHEAYSQAIAALHGLAERLAEQMPPRAGSGAHALAELDTAVQQAAAARGLLLAALNVPTSTESVYDPNTGQTSTETVSSEADTKQRDALTAAAQQARLRSDAALTAFRESAPESAVESYDSTVTGGEVETAEKYLTTLTDQPKLSDKELDTSAKKLDAALSARVDLMRGVESSFYDRRTKDLAQLRDDDVTALEIRIALLGALTLIAVGIATAMARSLTRPLAVLRLGSARLAGAENPAAEEPVRFTGRNDEFAQVVRSVNALHEHAVALHERVTTLESDRKHLVGQRQKMADAREELRAELAEAADRLERLRTSISGTFVNLSLRTLGLVERQLTVIEGLEEREQDPDRLATLFKLDHFATVMRRHSENLLVLAGTEHVQQHAGPIPLVDVVRAAVSEIERYERVRISALPPHAHVAGFAADDLSHLLAELMENATSFSPPDLPVEVSGWLLENGEVMLSVQDEGIGMTGERLTRLNARLTEFDPDTPYDQEGEDGLGLGLYVVARLAHRHGVRVQLREQKQGGVAAVVVLPTPLLAPAPVTAAIPATAPTSPSTGAFSLPGADAEANSNVLPARPKPNPDPLVTLAEKAVRKAASETPAETTMELLLPSPQGETETPGETDRTGQPGTDADPSATAHTADAPRAADRPARGPVDNGLPNGDGRAADQAAGDRASEDLSATGAVGGGRSAAEDEAADRTIESRAADGLPSDDGRAADGLPSDDGRAADGLPAGDGWAADRVAADRTTDDPAATDRTVPGPSGEDHAVPGPSATDHAIPGPSPADRPIPGPATAPRTASVAGTPPRTTPGPAAADGVFAPQGPPVPGDESGTGGAGGRAPAGDEAEAEHTRTPDAPDELLTDKGLPKRTPKLTAPTPAPRQRTGSVDAEALRRRLGGFRRGAEAGYRDVEAEIAEQTAQNKAPQAPHAPEAPQAAHAHAHAEEDTGGTVEEASS
ncbi:nitrate- and nitrite sensing domain-containing protein [Streptomyces sp. NPDC013178]|uniref:sensor histidine kinase n=1 Tax=Streptomyces sp. NPDC013178 TaxID=3155118 RepID=UPI003407C1A4